MNIVLGNPWTQQEERSISRNYVTTTQFAHKDFIRQFKMRSTLFDMVPYEVTEVMMESHELQAENDSRLETQMHGTDSVPEPSILEPMSVNP
ncbi:predicted protein [Arabidopsis lyrata subsp. lyrata]|uniref:Predicted protein n=1 Tax=Arabidopsis lyrata subsp. lyrata TaxID=81972 RepID=D7MBZ2_ARALL|nr:predicted protein [Arabidopsis lyrata subsp. lyrata]